MPTFEGINVYQSENIGTADAVGTLTIGSTACASTMISDCIFVPGTYYESSSNWVSGNTISFGMCPPETTKQRKERMRLERKRLKYEKKKEQKRIVAEQVANDLLREILGEEYKPFEDVGFIELDSHKYPNHKYRLSKNHMAYIEIINEEGKVVDCLCTHPVIQCPPSDHLLYRWSMIRYCEEELNKVANHWGGRYHSYYENQQQEQERNDRVEQLENDGYTINPTTLFFEREGSEPIAMRDVYAGAPEWREPRVYGDNNNPLTEEEAMSQPCENPYVGVDNAI